MRDDRKDPAFAPEMPDAGSARYLLDHLWSAGPTLLNGMGSGPLTHQEIAAWQANTGNELTGWEAATLRLLSAAYLEQVQEARLPDCPSPLAPPELSAEDKKLVATKTRNIMRNFGSGAKR